MGKPEFVYVTYIATQSSKPETPGKERRRPLHRPAAILAAGSQDYKGWHGNNDHEGQSEDRCQVSHDTRHNNEAPNCPVADLTLGGSLPCGLGHRLRVKPTPMTRQAVCTRDGAQEGIVAVCRRKGRTYRVNMTALEWVARPPVGAEWSDA